MVVETEKCSISMKMASPEDVSEVLAHIGTNLRKIFPGLSPVWGNDHWLVYGPVRPTVSLQTMGSTLNNLVARHSQQQSEGAVMVLHVHGQTRSGPRAPLGTR